MVRFTPIALALALAAAPAFAQTPSAPMKAMPGMMDGKGMSAMDREMMKRMQAMNTAMSAAPMTGDPDQDFVAMMMPHHQGAIDMARIYLSDGKDPEIRKMAEAIVSAPGCQPRRQTCRGTA